MTREIPLTKGLVTLVDDADFDWLNEWKWYAAIPTASPVRYAQRVFQTPGRRVTLQMHRLIMTPPAGFLVDHINRDGLDNRRANLRLATISQNIINKDYPRREHCPYRGVYRGKTKFIGQIAASGTQHYLGVFEKAEDAARAYDEAALRLHGDFAQLNFPTAEA